MSETGDHADLLGAEIHFNAHDEDSRLPCLCCDCIAAAGESAQVDGAKFVRRRVVEDGRALHYWLPVELLEDSETVAERVRRRLAKHLAVPPKGGTRRLRFNHWRLKQKW